MRPSPLRPLLASLLLGLTVLTVAGAWASEENEAKRPQPRVGAADRQEAQTAANVAASVDRLLEASFAQSGTKTAPLTRDEDFLRRITLDLAGTIPTAKDVTYFGLDPSPTKREDLIEQLLARVAQTYTR